MSFLSKTLGKIVGGAQSVSGANPPNTSSGETISKNEPSHYQYPAQSTSHGRTSTLSQHHSSDVQLTLTHLRKLFYEYLHPKNPYLGENDRRDDKLYSILPLFIKVIYNKNIYYSFLNTLNIDK